MGFHNLRCDFLVNSFSRVVDAVRDAGLEYSQPRTDQLRVQNPNGKDKSIALYYDGHRTKVHSFGNFPSEDFPEAIGLRWSDFYDEPVTHQSKQWGAAYSYGTSTIFRPMVKGQPFRTSGGRPTTLFRVEDVKSAVQRGSTIYLVEGEADVLMAERHGLVATTAANGAKSVDKVDLSPLVGADVVVIPDNDEPGSEWLNKLLPGLRACRSVTVKRLPDGIKDISDLYGLTDMTVDDLIVEPQRRKGKKLISANKLPESKPIEWLGYDFLPRGMVSVLISEEGLGKTTLLSALHAAVTAGVGFDGLGIPPGNPENTAAIFFEDSRIKVQSSVQEMGGDLTRFYVPEQAEDDDPENDSGAAYADDLDMFRGHNLALLTVDPVAEVIPPGVQMGTPNDARAVLRPWSAFARQENCAVLLVGHTNRLDSPNLRDRVGMSAQLRTLARSFLFALKCDDGFLVGVDKTNLAAVTPAVKFRVVIKETGRTDSRGLAETVGTVEFVEVTDKTISEWAKILYDASKHDESGSECTEWLAARFGNAYWIDAAAAAKECPFTANQLRVARESLGITRDADLIRYVGQGSMQKTWWGRSGAPTDLGAYLTITEHGRKPEKWNNNASTSDNDVN